MLTTKVGLAINLSGSKGTSNWENIAKHPSVLLTSDLDYYGCGVNATKEWVAGSVGTLSFAMIELTVPVSEVQNVVQYYQKQGPIISAVAAERRLVAEILLRDDKARCATIFYDTENQKYGYYFQYHIYGKYQQTRAVIKFDNDVNAIESAKEAGTEEVYILLLEVADSQTREWCEVSVIDVEQGKNILRQLGPYLVGPNGYRTIKEAVEDDSRFSGELADPTTWDACNNVKQIDYLPKSEWIYTDDDQLVCEIDGNNYQSLAGF